MVKSKSLIIIHSEADIEAVTEFSKHLTPLTANGNLSVLRSHDIQLSTNWKKTIKSKLKGANIIIFWISSDLWNAPVYNFIVNKPSLFLAATQIIPIVARNSTWEAVPFFTQHKSNVLPSDQNPLPIDDKLLQDAWMDNIARLIVNRLGFTLPGQKPYQKIWEKISLEGRLGLSAALIALFLAIPSFIADSCEIREKQSQRDVKTSTSIPSCGFPTSFEKDTLYILITRFEDFQNEHSVTCYGEAIKWHINDVANKYHLPIKTCYQDLYSPSDVRDADLLRDENHADLIIWGRLDNAGPDCTADGFCLLFNPSDTLIGYVNGISHKTDLSDFQENISDSQVIKGQFRMGKKVFDNWLIDMSNLKIGKHKPGLFIIENNWPESERLEAHMMRANIWSGLGKYHEAIADWDRAISINPQDALLFNNRGGDKLSIGNTEEAIADYDRALNIDSNLILVYNNRGFAKLGSKSKVNSAIDDFQHVINKAPDFPDIYRYKGDANFVLNRYADAILDYNIAIKKKPSDKFSYLNRAATYKKLGDFKKAIADYDHAIKLNPQFALAYSNRGATKYRLGLIKDAILDYNQAIILDPNDAVAYNNRAGARKDLGEYKDAVADYDKAIEISPKFDAAIEGRINALFRLGRNKAALSGYDQILKEDSLNSLAFNNRGATNFSAGRYLDAIEDYSQAVKLNPKFALALSNRSAPKLAIGDIQGAISDSYHAIKIDPNCAYCYIGRGDVRARLDSFYEALLDYNQCIELKPNKMEGYLARGNFWFDRQDFRKAIEDYNKVLTIDKNLLDIYRKRAKAKQKIGRPISSMIDQLYVTWLDPLTRWRYIIVIFLVYLLVFKKINRFFGGILGYFTRREV